MISVMRAPQRPVGTLRSDPIGISDGRASSGMFGEPYRSDIIRSPA